MLKNVRRLWLIALIVLAGCGKKLPEGGEYDVTGEVVSMDLENNTVTLSHGAIGDGLKAGETDFVLSDPRMVDRIGTGNQVKGHFQVKSGKYVLTELTRVGGGGD